MKKEKLVFLRFAIFTLLFIGCTKDDGPGTDPDPDPTPETATLTISGAVVSAQETSVDGSLTLQLNNFLTTALTVNITVSGTATNGTDYETIGNSVSIPANTKSFSIAVNVLEDTDEEDPETVIVTIGSTNNTNVTIGSAKEATVTIADAPQPISFSPSEAASFMVNPNSTEETIALFYNLKVLSQTSTIVGQQDAFSEFYNEQGGDSDIKKTTGNDPGLLGLDYSFITDDQNDGTPSNWFFQQEELIVADAIKAYDLGMVTTFAWHLREPYEGTTFYTDEMTDFHKENAFKSILPGGANHEYYKEKLDKVAQVAASMVGGDGKLAPIIFRPFHEFDGDWFWWGAAWCTPTEYKTLWKFTVEYLRDDLGATNILYAFSPDNHFNSENEYLSRYPGDAYVDILGMDNYGDFSQGSQAGVDAANNKLKIVSDLANEKIKIAALTETAKLMYSDTSPIPNFFTEKMYPALTDNNVNVGFVMFWNNYRDSYYSVPAPGLPNADDFKAFTDKPEILLQNELPDLYTLPED